MPELYPGLEPYASGRLAVDPTHALYWEEAGNPKGVPVAYLHGGPGAGAHPIHRQFFDPGHYRIVIHDQRGAGRSRPRGSLENNDPAALVADMERLRIARGIDKWILFGGSWGSALALAYATTHPDRVLGLILRGIFLMRKTDVDWIFDGLPHLYPEAHAGLAALLQPQDAGDLSAAVERALHDPDPAVRLAAARAWCRYESVATNITVQPEPDLNFADPQQAIDLARIELHFIRHHRFTPDDALLRGIDRIRHLPAAIIHGRYDMICPLKIADDLHQAWPEADYIVVPDGGHAALEPAIRSALVAATDRFRTIRP